MSHKRGTSPLFRGVLWTVLMGDWALEMAGRCFVPLTLHLGRSCSEKFPKNPRDTSPGYGIFVYTQAT
ncbi:hypothetical protein SUGI_0844200 [Cryptomeria japonica]|nr:hypothetical protein SUGI_0844200 [Cryptomeria japonica]